MTNIKINELKPDESKQPKGSEFFEEQEGYLDNLSEEELNARGGADDISISGGDYVSYQVAVKDSSFSPPASPASPASPALAIYYV